MNVLIIGIVYILSLVFSFFKIFSQKDRERQISEFIIAITAFIVASAGLWIQYNGDKIRNNELNQAKEEVRKIQDQNDTLKKNTTQLLFINDNLSKTVNNLSKSYKRDIVKQNNVNDFLVGDVSTYPLLMIVPSDYSAEKNDDVRVTQLIILNKSKYPIRNVTVITYDPVKKEVINKEISAIGKGLVNLIFAKPEEEMDDLISINAIVMWPGQKEIMYEVTFLLNEDKKTHKLHPSAKYIFTDYQNNDTIKSYSASEYKTMLDGLIN